MGEHEQRIVAGKTSFYHTLEQHTRPRFLHRNLNTVLDAHKRRLSGGTTDVDARTYWDLYDSPQCEKMLQAAFKGQTPLLSITGLKLRRPRRFTESTASPPSRATNEDGDPDWLPRDGESRLSCQISVAVLHPRKRKPCYLDSVRSTLYGRSRDTGNASFDITLQKPFEIALGSLTSAHDDVEPKAYHLELGFHFSNPEQETEFRSQIGASDSQDDPGHPDNAGLIVAAWAGLPDLPEPGTYLPLECRSGQHSHILPFGAEIRMSWNEPLPVLVTCNRALREERRARLQLPTPFSDDFEGPSDSVAIKYYFRVAWQVKSFDRKGLDCVFCNSRIQHSSFDRLRLHYLTYHDHFHIEASDDPNNPNGKIIRIKNQGEKPPGHERLNATEDWEWQAPEEAFDVEDHLNGSTMWMHPTLRVKIAAQKGRQRQPNTSPVKASKQKVMIRPKRQLLDPEDIPDLPVKRPRLHKVPHVPGISFYRTTSKQAIEPGTMTSDSDDELDESWIEQSQRQHLLDLGQRDMAIDFHELFNRHLSEERPMSDLLIRDAVVRFARKFRSKLSEPSWAEKFRQKLHQLETRRIIGRDVVDYCAKLIICSGENIWRGDIKRIVGTPEPEPAHSEVLPGSPRMPRSARSRNSHTESPKNDQSAEERKKLERWKIVAIRPEDQKLPTAEIAISEVSDLVAHTDRRLDAPQPDLVSWERLCKFLERELSFDANVETIWCRTNKVSWPVLNRENLAHILGMATRGPVVVEVLSRGGLAQRVREVKGGEFAQKGAETAAQGKHKEAQSKKDLCVCGERVTTRRKTIACANATCVRAFHMHCVGLKKRTLDWRCPECP